MIKVKFTSQYSEPLPKGLEVNTDYETCDVDLTSEGRIYAFKVKQDDTKTYFIRSLSKFDGIVFNFDCNDPWGYSEDIICDRRTKFLISMSKVEVMNAIYVKVAHEFGDYDTLNTFAKFLPFKSKTVPGNVCISASRQKVDQNKETPMSPGRAFRAMFPDVHDRFISSLVSIFVEGEEKEQNLTISEGSEREDFKKVYTMPVAAMKNPDTTFMRKALSNSCMQKSFDHLKCHPTEAFASGDFKIIYVTNEDGHLASRVIVSTKNMVQGPIYGTSETSINILQDKIENEGYKEGKWLGCKLLRIPHNYSEDQFIGAYLDISPTEISDDGEDLIIDGCGEINGSCHMGILETMNQCHCDICEDPYDDEDVWYMESTSQSVCHHCRDEYFFYCEYMDDLESIDSSVTLHSSSGEEMISEWASCNCEEIMYCDVYDQYWVADEVSFCEFDSNNVSHKAIDNGLYAYCSITNELFPACQLTEWEDELVNLDLLDGLIEEKKKEEDNEA